MAPNPKARIVGPVLYLILSAICLIFTLALMIKTTDFNVNAFGIREGTEESKAWTIPRPRSYEESEFFTEMMAEQNRRRALIDKACSAAGKSRMPELDETASSVFKGVGHLLVDDKYKLLFGFIPKVGCTTWKGVIRNLRRTHGGDLDKVTDLRKFKDNLTEITYRLKHYRKVLFVREPVTRMLSAYLNKLRNLKHLQRIWENFIGQSIVKMYRGYDHAERFKDDEDQPWMNITLPEFIQYITNIGPDIKMNELNDHWLPLHVVSNPCQINYDFIGHYENLATEAPFLLQWLGIDTVVRFPPVHASHASDNLVKEYSRVSLGLLKILYDYYDFDYKAFGYHKNETISYLLKGIFDDADNE